LPFLLGAILTNGFFHGLAQLALGGALYSFKGEAISNIYFPLMASALLLGTMFFILRSQFGKSLAIYGNNPRFFKQHGISTSYIVMGGIALANACAGLGGYLFAQSNGFVDLSINYGVILVCLTALTLGKMAIHQEGPSLIVPVTGVVAFFILQQFLLKLGMDLKYFNAVQAIFVLMAFLGLRKKETNLLTIDHLGV
jgi:putative ABC transport system permease protein